MARRTLLITQADVTRALRGAAAAGVEIARVEVDPAKGNIVLFTKAADFAPSSTYDAWKAKGNAH